MNTKILIITLKMKMKSRINHLLSFGVEMKKAFLNILLLFTASFATANASIASEEFISYHLKVATENIEDEEIFHLIQENIKNLKDRGASDTAANELINLIEEGYTIDPFNISKLIETLTYRDASNNATKVMIKAIEYDSSITSDHLFNLIQTLGYADASNNATDVILSAIKQGVKFGPKERRHLAEMSKIVNAKKNVEKIRKALHERALD